VAKIHVHDFDHTEGTFTTDEGFSRTFQASGVPLGFRSQVIADQYSVSSPKLLLSFARCSYFQVAKFPTIRGINATELMSGLFVVSFSDIRDAIRAAELTKSILPFSTIMPYTGKKYAELTGADVQFATDYEGQMLLSMYYNPNAVFPRVEAAPVMLEVKRLLGQCGDVKAFHTITATNGHVRECRVEFFNTEHVAVAVDVIRGTVIHVRLNPFLTLYSC
jgi:hypothetical protein